MIILNSVCLSDTPIMIDIRLLQIREPKAVHDRVRLFFHFHKLIIHLIGRTSSALSLDML
jgi:hypothetical protein